MQHEGALADQLAAVLADGGYAVDVARAGGEAEFLGRTERYDVVILDMGLPTLDGLTVLRRWRAAGHQMPVLVLTARGSWHEKVRGIDGGADDYMAKPFQVEEVMGALAGRRACRGRRHRHRREGGRRRRGPGAGAAPAA